MGIVGPRSKLEKSREVRSSLSLSLTKNIDSICDAVGLGPEYVSPIAAIGSFTSRGEDCSKK